MGCVCVCVRWRSVSSLFFSLPFFLRFLFYFWCLFLPSMFLSFLFPFYFRIICIVLRCKMMQWKGKVWKKQNYMEQMRHFSIHWIHNMCECCFAILLKRVLAHWWTCLRLFWASLGVHTHIYVYRCCVLSCEKREASLHCNILGCLLRLIVIQCEQTVSLHVQMTLTHTHSHSFFLSHSEIIETVPLFYTHHPYGFV